MTGNVDTNAKRVKQKITRGISLRKKEMCENNEKHEERFGKKSQVI